MGPTDMGLDGSVSEAFLAVYFLFFSGSGRSLPSTQMKPQLEETREIELRRAQQ